MGSWLKYFSSSSLSFDINDEQTENRKTIMRFFLLHFVTPK